MTAKAPDQTAFRFPDAYEAEQAYGEILKICRSIADRIGRKEVAFELDLRGSSLDNALADRDRHSLKARQILYFLLKDSSGELITKLATLAGFEAKRAQPVLTAEQKLDLLKARIRKRLGNVADEIIDEALGR